MIQLLSASPSVVRPCSRCGLFLKDPASIQAGLGPICRGFANQILAKELPSVWSDSDLAALMFLGAETFAAEDQARYTKVFEKICASKGMNQTEAATGDDMRAVARELVYLSSVTPTRTVYEALIGAIRGIGYPVYAAYVCGDSSTGEAKFSYEDGRLILRAVRNSAGRAALAHVGAHYDSHLGGFVAAPYQERKMAVVVSVYWPMVQGIEDSLAALQLDTAPSIRCDENGISFSVPYSPTFVEDLHAIVPRLGRYFNYNDRAWFITAKHADAATALVVKYYGR